MEWLCFTLHQYFCCVSLVAEIKSWFCWKSESLLFLVCVSLYQFLLFPLSSSFWIMNHATTRVSTPAPGFHYKRKTLRFDYFPPSLIVKKVSSRLSDSHCFQSASLPKHISTFPCLYFGFFPLLSGSINHAWERRVRSSGNFLGVEWVIN